MSSSRLSLSTRKRTKTIQTEVQTTTPNTVVKFVNDHDAVKVICGVNLQGSLSVSSESIQERSASRNKEHPKLSVLRSAQGKRKQKKTSDCESENEENQSCNVSLTATCERPVGLYDENDVAGENMCSFHTPKKKGAMMQKAVDSASKNKNILSAEKSKSKTFSKIKSQADIQTPINKSSSRQTKSQRQSTTSVSNKIKMSGMGQDSADYSITKTPYSLRARKKQLIQECKRMQVDCNSDFEDSNYFSSSSSDSSYSLENDDDEQDDSDSGKGSENVMPPCRRSLRYQTPSTLTSGLKEKDLNYICTPDEYFHCQSSKLATSDHRLSRLSTPQLDTSTLLSLLKQCSVSPIHQNILTNMRKHDQNTFERWMFVLSRGFNILAYGLGSKYKILQSFRDSVLNNSHVLVINGFFPGVTIKEIVEMIAKDLLGVSLNLPSPQAVLDHMERMRWMPRVFLIVHNLDAEMLRCENAQLILSRLASLPKVHLIASVDHINCPLLWDQETLSHFNFVWEDTTSFLPYQEETSYETNLMVQNSGSLAVTSLLNVYRSLPKNSQGVLRIILEKHLDSNQNYKGIAFSDLYRQCREDMLVANDLALRTMLTEFLDHQMVKWRKDGELLHMPSDVTVLRSFHNLL